jgi:hypothetical protein
MRRRRTRVGRGLVADVLYPRRKSAKAA